MSTAIFIQWDYFFSLMNLIGQVSIRKIGPKTKANNYFSIKASHVMGNWNSSYSRYFCIIIYINTLTLIPSFNIMLSISSYL
jgi:hypothetical protein